MRIAFIRPMAPFNRYIQNVPLNYVHLAAWLRKRGHQASILDMVFDDVTPGAVDRHIRDNAIRVAGIGAMTCELPQAIEEARRLKAVHPGIYVVFGGAHPSADPEECLRTGVVDSVVAGEGEVPLAALLDALEAGRGSEGIAGVWPSPPGPPPDVESLPPPAFDLLDLDKYFRLDSPWHFPKSARAVQFITSRGCPYHCSYCHEVHGKKFRGLSAQKVLDQMEGLVRDHGVREFMVVDDIFNFDLGRAKAICRGIVERRLGVHLQFPNGVRGDRFDEELVMLMKQAGTHFMSIAIETVSDRYQRLIRKNLKIDKSLQAIEWARKHSIEVSGFFMIGFPGETIEDVRATLKFAASAPLDAIFISLVSPFKGTVLRTDMVNGRFGAMDADGAAALGQLFPIVHNRQLPIETLRGMQKRAYWRFYARPRTLASLARKLTNRHNARKIARAVLRRVFGRQPTSVN